jgi:hypothetical protein
MALSLAAMAIAAAGWLPPAAGALLQEGIDVAVILNALRALGAGRGSAVTLTRETDRLLHRFATEHDQLADAFPLLRRAAALIVAGPSEEALDALQRAHRFLTERLLPHEHGEETQLYPALAAPLGSPEATAPMSRTHAEIERLTSRLGAHLAHAESAGGIEADQVEDLLATTYGLYAVLRLHFRQEEESYFALAADVADATDAIRPA